MKRVVVAALLGALAGCTNFPVIEADECGNGVLEKGEDCDTYAEGIRGAKCRPPGGTNPCRFDCSEQSDGSLPVCPQEMGCSSDGVCRSYTGGLEAPKLISSDLSTWVSAADFDGDGRMDVISSEPEDQFQRARFRVHYFDANTQLAETRTFPRVTTRPLARRLDRDDTDDLVFSNSRIGLLPGRKDRSFLPATFSSYVVEAAELRAVSVSDNVVGEEEALGIVVFTTLGGVRGVFVPVRSREQLALRQELARPLQDLVAPPLAADLVTSPDSPCAEVVFGYRGERYVQVLDLCELASQPLDIENQWRVEPRRQDVYLPRGVTLQGPPLAADVDGDGHLDLLLNDLENTYVAYGDGVRLQSEASRLTLPVEGGAAPLALPKLLAAGDITGDGAADFVIPLAVIGSRKSKVDGSTVYVETFENSSLPWSTAFVGDLNGNGHADVVAATAGADGISFVNGSSGPFALGARITTRGPVRALTTGDFDGDLMGDIAYVEGDSTGGRDLLAMCYGARDRLPLDPLRVATVEGLEQLGRQRALGVDDVFVTSSERVGGAVRGKFTLFAGDSSRLPFAPYTLVMFESDGPLNDQTAPALLLGSFTRPGQDDVLALGTTRPEAPWSQWLLPHLVAGNDPPALLDQGSAPPPTSLTVDESEGPRLSVAGVAADVDGDGLDEAVWLMPGPDDACALLVYAVDAARRTVALQSQLRLDAPCGVPQLASFDLNTDGALDLLALVGEGNGSPRRLHIMWNDGGGGFSLEDRSPVDPPGDEEVRAFARVPGGGVKLALVTPSAAFTATTAEDSRQWRVSPVSGSSFVDARAVVVTDLNQDAFPDMVVADARGLWLSKAELR